MDKFIALFNLLHELDLFNCNTTKHKKLDGYYIFTIATRHTAFSDAHFNLLHQYGISCSQNHNTKEIAFSARVSDEKTLLVLFTEILKDLIAKNPDKKLVDKVIAKSDEELELAETQQSEPGPYTHLLFELIKDADAAEAEKKLAEQAEKEAKEFERKLAAEAEAKRQAEEESLLAQKAAEEALAAAMQEDVERLQAKQAEEEAEWLRKEEEAKIAAQEAAENEIIEEIPPQTPPPARRPTEWSLSQAGKREEIKKEEKLSTTLQATLDNLWKIQEKCYKPADVNHYLDVTNAARNAGQKIVNLWNAYTFFGSNEAAINIVEEFKALANIIPLGWLYDRAQLGRIENSIKKRLLHVQQDHLKDGHTQEIALLASAQKTVEEIRPLLDKRQPPIPKEADDAPLTLASQGYHS